MGWDDRVAPVFLLFHRNLAKEALNKNQHDFPEHRLEPPILVSAVDGTKEANPDSGWDDHSERPPITDSHREDKLHTRPTRTN
jgi:hypothetical protein